MFNKFFLFLFLINGGVLAFSVPIFVGEFENILPFLGLFTAPLILVFIFGRRGVDKEKENRIIPLILAELIALGTVIFIGMTYLSLGLGYYTEHEKKLLELFAIIMSIPFFSYIASGIFLIFYNIKTSKKST